MQDHSIQSRPVGGQEDFWHVRELLARTVPVSPIGHNWDVRRWDGQYFYNPSGCWENGWVQHVWLWETAGGRLVGCVNPEGRGAAGIQVDPAYRFLEEEMLAWAEARLAAPPGPGGGRALEFMAFEYDTLRHRLLRARGYEKTAEWGVLRHLRMPARPLPSVRVVAPYEMRQVNPEDDGDCQRIADLLNAAFRRTFHNGPEYQEFARHAPCYVNELDLVAVAPDGSFAAYVGMPYDHANCRGIFEPVCTHPDHVRRGLAGSLMREALHRVQRMGALDVTVDTGDMLPANALYDSLGFTEAYQAFGWRKVWNSGAPVADPPRPPHAQKDPERG